MSPIASGGGLLLRATSSGGTFSGRPPLGGCQVPLGAGGSFGSCLTLVKYLFQFLQ